MDVPFTGGDSPPCRFPRPEASRLRVVLADDEALLREGLASLLDRSGFTVVGQVGDGGRLLALVREPAPIWW